MATTTTAAMEFDERQTMHIMNGLAMLRDAYINYVKEFTENPNNSPYTQTELDAICVEETGSTPTEVKAELAEITSMYEQFALINSVQKQLNDHNDHNN